MICYKHETYTTSKDIANILNKIFIDKVKKLRIETASFVIGKAKERLRAWLDSRNSVPSTFNFKCIDLRTLRKILSKLKGNRSCGVDFVDGYSIKLAAPIIEDILLHLVNISISQSKYPQCWKVSKIIPHHKKVDGTNGEN